MKEILRYFQNSKLMLIENKSCIIKQSLGQRTNW